MVLWKDMECWLFYYQILMSKEKICACSNGCTWSTIEYADCVHLLSFDGWNPNFNYFQFLDLEGVQSLIAFILHTKSSDQTLWLSEQSCFVLGSPKFKFCMTTICDIRLLVLCKWDICCFVMPKKNSSWAVWPLKKGPIICPKTSVINCQSTLHNITEKRWFHICYLSWFSLNPPAKCWNGIQIKPCLLPSTSF